MTLVLPLTRKFGRVFSYPESSLLSFGGAENPRRVAVARKQRQLFIDQRERIAGVLFKVAMVKSCKGALMKASRRTLRRLKSLRVVRCSCHLEHESNWGFGYTGSPQFGYMLSMTLSGGFKGQG